MGFVPGLFQELPFVFLPSETQCSLSSLPVWLEMAEGLGKDLSITEEQSCLSWSLRYRSQVHLGCNGVG